MTDEEQLEVTAAACLERRRELDEPERSRMALAMHNAMESPDPGLAALRLCAVLRMYAPIC